MPVKHTQTTWGWNHWALPLISASGGSVKPPAPSIFAKQDISSLFIPDLLYLNKTEQTNYLLAHTQMNPHGPVPHWKHVSWAAMTKATKISVILRFGFCNFHPQDPSHSFSLSYTDKPAERHATMVIFLYPQGRVLIPMHCNVDSAEIYSAVLTWLLSFPLVICSRLCI